MPRIARPDGVELHFEALGSGPSVVFALPWNAHPRPFALLLDDLIRDHRVVLYHPRGTGESTRRGPYEPETDAGDLAAVVEAVGEPGVLVLALLDAVPRAIRAALALPEAVGSVVATNSMLRVRAPGRTATAMADSPSVLQVMLQMIETSYRAGVRTVLTTGNPDLTEVELHQRVEEIVQFVDAEAAAERLRRWIRDETLLDNARALGGRLWWLTIPTNPWFPADLDERLHEHLPDAHVEALEDGPFTRPELTAAVVRRITGAG
jgi:pimeloyl-ACP methyl ester carboxylesterase